MNAIEFRNNVALQENESLFLKDAGYRVQRNPAPEDKGGWDIAFGHKITREEEESGKIYGILFTKGITKEEALTILEFDIQKHMASAQRFIGSKFEKLPIAAKQLMCDFSFTGTLHKFPKLILSIFDKNYLGVLAQYKRYFTRDGERVEMKRRNFFAAKLIQDLKDYGYFGD